MKVLNKEIPADYKYTIEISHGELQDLESLVGWYFCYRNFSPDHDPRGYLWEELRKILNKK